jgi:hypothetical protein
MAAIKYKSTPLISLRKLASGVRFNSRLRVSDDTPPDIPGVTKVQTDAFAVQLLSVTYSGLVLHKRIPNTFRRQLLSTLDPSGNFRIVLQEKKPTQHVLSFF